MFTCLFDIHKIRVYIYADKVDRSTPQTTLFWQGLYHPFGKPTALQNAFCIWFTCLNRREMSSRCLGDVSGALHCFSHPKTALKFWNTFYVFRAKVWRLLLGAWTSPYVACLYGPFTISYLTWQLVAMKKDCCRTQCLKTVPSLFVAFLYASDNKHWLWTADFNWQCNYRETLLK